MSLESLESSGDIGSFSKKMKATLDRERRKITRNLQGIRKMARPPGALVILDVRREQNAVKEARKLGIPTVCLVDTDSDPDGVDIIIPGNDDAMRAIELILAQLVDAMEVGKRGRPVAASGEKDGGGPARPRRSRRPTISELAEREVSADQRPTSEASAVESGEVVEAVASPSPSPEGPAAEVSNDA